MDASGSSVPPVSAVADVLALWEIDGWLTPPLVTMVAPPTPVLGRARTIEVEPGSSGAGLGDLYDLLSHDLAGCVVVMAGACTIPGAMWGEIFSTAARSRGAVGALIDGTARDVDATTSIGLALYARGRDVVGPAGRAHVVGIDDAVNVQGVDIIAGDVIVLDGSGCVRIPEEVETEVLDAARRYAAAETEVLRELTAGTPLTRAYLAKRAIVNELGAQRLAGTTRG